LFQAVFESASEKRLLFPDVLLDSQLSSLISHSEEQVQIDRTAGGIDEEAVFHVKRVGTGRRR
jgi:hypothetical protein